MPDKRILLVEDEIEIRQLLGHVLHAAGYAVDLAATLGDAWPLLDSQSYALVIADWRLPDGDGTLLLDWAADHDAETLLMSGFLFRMPGGRAERHETLMKPVRARELIEAVERSIGKSTPE